MGLEQYNYAYASEKISIDGNSSRPSNANAAGGEMLLPRHFAPMQPIYNGKQFPSSPTGIFRRVSHRPDKITSRQAYS